MENKTLPKSTFCTLFYGAMCFLCFHGATWRWDMHQEMWFCFLCAYGAVSGAIMAFSNFLYCLILLDEKPKRDIGKGRSL